MPMGTGQYSGRIVKHYEIIACVVIFKYGTYINTGNEETHMSLDMIQELALPIIGFIICLSFGIKAMDGDIQVLRGKGAPPIRNPKEYGKSAGRLLIIFGALLLVSGIIFIFSWGGGIGFLIIGTLIFAYFWKKNEDKYTIE